MAKIIDHGLAGPDDPIYTEGIRIFFIRKPTPPLEPKQPKGILHEPYPLNPNPRSSLKPKG
jgi:hypothetical protein